MVFLSGRVSIRINRYCLAGFSTGSCSNGGNNFFYCGEEIPDRDTFKIYSILFGVALYGMDTPVYITIGTKSDGKRKHWSMEGNPKTQLAF